MYELHTMKRHIMTHYFITGGGFVIENNELTSCWQMTSYNKKQYDGLTGHR